MLTPRSFSDLLSDLFSPQSLVSINGIEISDNLAAAKQILRRVKALEASYIHLLTPHTQDSVFYYHPSEVVTNRFDSLGYGGFGSVKTGKIHPKPELGTVAVKEVHLKSKDPRSIYRFIREVGANVYATHKIR